MIILTNTQFPHLHWKSEHTGVNQKIFTTMRKYNNSVTSVEHVSAVGGVRHPHHTQTSSSSSTIAADTSNGATNTRCCRYSCLRSSWWLMVPTETCRAVSRWNKLCKVVSCWIYIRILLRCTDSKYVEQFPNKINCVTLHLVGYIVEYYYDIRTYES
jgi:hypothetical protein